MRYIHKNHTLTIKPFFSLSSLQTINDVMQPSAAKAVRKWMKTADNKGYTLNATQLVYISYCVAFVPERQVAVHLFSSLGPRAGRPRSMSEPSIRPLSRQPLPPYLAPPPPLPGSAVAKIVSY